MEFLIKIIIVIIIAAFFGYIIPVIHFSKPWVNSLIVAVISAVYLFGSSEIINMIGEIFDKPQVYVSIQKKSTEININLKTKGTITRFSLNYPVQGIVTNLNDLNLIADAYTPVARIIGGASENDVQNILEISITNLKPDAQINYKVFYTPSIGNIFIMGNDKYQYSYEWEYKGEKKYKYVWKMVSDNSETTSPNASVQGVQIFNRELTPEEIKKIYESGPLKRNLN